MAADPAERLGADARFEPTDGEARLADIVSMAGSVLWLVTLVIGNVTGNWLPAFAQAAVLTAIVVAMTVRSARVRNQSVLTTVRQIARSRPPRRWRRGQTP